MLAISIFTQVLQEDPADHKLALSSYSKGLKDVGAGASGINSREGLRDRGELETHQAAWTNIAVLHEHLGSPAEAMSAYQHAFNEKGSEQRRADDNVDSDALLRVTDPANQLFWEWKELPATASAAEGSRTVRTSAPVGGALRKGTQVRVGEDYVTTAQGPEKEGIFEVADVAPDGVDGLALEGRLFKKVHKIRVTKENVSMVFNLALLHEKQGHHEAAQELHKAVLAEHPTYVNCECLSPNAQKQIDDVHRHAQRSSFQAVQSDGTRWCALHPVSGRVAPRKGMTQFSVQQRLNRMLDVILEYVLLSKN